MKIIIIGKYLGLCQNFSARKLKLTIYLVVAKYSLLVQKFFS